MAQARKVYIGSEKRRRQEATLHSPATHRPQFVAMTSPHTPDTRMLQHRTGNGNRKAGARRL